MELIKLIKFKLIEIIQLIKIIQKNKKKQIAIYKIASCHHGSDITIPQQYKVEVKIIKVHVDVKVSKKFTNVIN